jgi:hypothetical protein
MESIKRDRSGDFWLLLPWFTLGAVWIAGASGAPDWILDNLPYRLGDIAIPNIGWGMLVVTLGSSARWGYLQFWNRSRSVGELLRRVILCAIAITFAQFCVAAALVSIYMRWHG